MEGRRFDATLDFVILLSRGVTSRLRLSSLRGALERYGLVSTLIAIALPSNGNHPIAKRRLLLDSRRLVRSERRQPWAEIHKQHGSLSPQRP